MPDIYEIYLDIRTFWFSFGLMDGISRKHIHAVSDINCPDLFVDTLHDTPDTLSEENICRIRTYFGSCIFPSPHISY